MSLSVRVIAHLRLWSISLLLDEQLHGRQRDQLIPQGCESAQLRLLEAHLERSTRAILLLRDSLCP